MPAGTTSPPRSCSPTRACMSAKTSPGAKPASTGGACRCASRPRSPRTIPTRCSTSTPSDCNVGWATSPKVNGSTLVGHYTSRYKSFDALLVATRRRVFRRNPDNTVNPNLLSITLYIHYAHLTLSPNRAHYPPPQPHL